MKSNTNFLKYSAATILGIGLATGSAHAFTLTPTDNGDDLVNTILGSGITIVPGSINYDGAIGASGIFTEGLSSGIGIDNGIILTTGQAADAAGTNNSDGTTTANGLPGDGDLNSLIPGFSTLDATVLSFDFESTGGDLFFQYVFASEEYNEFVNSGFNDVFGFFLDGVNIALIPETTTPVAINNVNLGSNSAFYNNNDPSDLVNPTPFDIEYDGFTNVFTAQALGLTPGQHSLKLAIADAGDSILDSAVFLQAGSVSDQPTDNPTEKVPEPTTVLSLLTVGAFGVSSTLNRKQKQLAK